MRGATQCAKRVKQILKSLRTKLGRVPKSAQGDPITQLMLGILSRDVPESKARDALDRLRAHVVDYNELRVIPVFELADALGDFPNARRKAEDLSRALNRIFLAEHAVSLQCLEKASRRDVDAYLRRIDGLEAYTIARIRLLGLGQPAAPLDEAMWAYAKENGLIDPKCSLEEAQNFLERQLGGEELPEFIALLRKAAWNEKAAAVRKGDVDRILSVPPDRTSRNMLQAVASASAGSDAADEPDEIETPEPPAELADAPDDAIEAPKAARRAGRSRGAGSDAVAPAKRAARSDGGGSRRAAKPRAAARIATPPAKPRRSRSNARSA